MTYYKIKSSKTFGYTLSRMKDIPMHLFTFGRVSILIEGRRRK